MFRCIFNKNPIWKIQYTCKKVLKIKSSKKKDFEINNRKMIFYFNLYEAFWLKIKKAIFFSIPFTAYVSSETQKDSDETKKSFWYHSHCSKISVIRAGTSCTVYVLQLYSPVWASYCTVDPAGFIQKM